MRISITLLILSLCVPVLAQRGTALLTLPQVLDSIEILMDKNHLPGLLLTLVTRDSVLYDGGLGAANREQGRPVDATQLFRMGSISKSFAALCMLRLEAEGKLSLQDKLADVAPEVLFTNPWEATDPVRVVHLLEHTAGFDDMHFKAMYNYGSVEPPVLDMVNHHAASLTSRWQPGTRMSYSNPGYVIATYLVEKLSGMSYHDYVRQTVFAPLDMAYSDFMSFPVDSSRYAQGYTFKGDGRYEPIPFYAVYAGMAGALNSCGHDMARFLQFFLRDGRVDSTRLFTIDQLRRMETPRTSLAAQAGLVTGYGLANYTSRLDQPTLWHGHNGGIDGFTSAYSYNRELGVGFALSNNAGGSMSDIEKLIVAFFTQNAPAAPLPSPKPVEEAELTPWMGYFDFRSPRNQLFYFGEKLTGGIDVDFHRDTLYIKRFLQPAAAYVHAGDHLFRKTDQYHSVLALTRDGAGTAVVAVGGYYEAGNALAARILLGWIALSQLLVSTFLLFGFIWMLVRLFTGSGSSLALAPVVCLFLGGLGFLAMSVGLVLALQDLPSLGSQNSKTLTLYLGSLIFAIGTAAGLALTLMRWPQLKGIKYYLLAVGVGGLSLVLFLADNGWIGLRLWVY